jgi:hypothetical protein
MDCSDFPLVQPKNRRGDTRAQPWKSHWPPSKDDLVECEVHQPGAKLDRASLLLKSAQGGGVGKNKLKLYKIDDDEPEAKKEEKPEERPVET